MPMTTPVAKISLSFQLSGSGDGLTLSLEIVMIVPRRSSQVKEIKNKEKKRKEKLNEMNV